MRLEHSFTRTEATLGTDVAPTDDTYLENDNSIEFARYGFDADAKAGIVVGYSFDGGAGLAPDVLLDIYFWDANSEQWYLVAEEVQARQGDAKYIPIPTPFDRTVDRQHQVEDIAIVASPTVVGPYPAGNYSFHMASIHDVGGGEVELQSEYEEDTQHTSGDVGQLTLVVRNDTLSSLVDADGDYAPLQVNSDGALYVSNSGSYAEDSLHVSGDLGQFILAVRNDTLASLVDADGDYAPLQVGPDGAVYTRAQGMASDDENVVGAPLLTAGQYLEDPPANPLDDTDVGTFLVDSIRQAVATLGTKIAGEEFNLDFLRAIAEGSHFLIDEAGTYGIKGLSGVLLKIIYLNVAETSSTATVYDNTTAGGTVMVPTHNMTTTELPGNQPHEVEFNIAFTVGLTVVTTGDTNIIVVYR